MIFGDAASSGSGGSTDPGPTDPGSTDPGPTDPGSTDPGPTDAGPASAGPAKSKHAIQTSSAPITGEHQSGPRSLAGWSPGTPASPRRRPARRR
ncbi:MAG: hypothetical protein EXR69_06370 [Myxococcales bacterium]|nr:hypothetical protein [Myxococcales bacterium]